MSNKQKNQSARVFYFDLHGKREEKYDFLDRHSLQSIDFTELPNISPNYFIVQKDFALEEKYKRGFNISELFSFSTSGVKTHDDKNFVDNNSRQLESKVFEKIGYFKSEKIKKYNYRPFDISFIYYDNTILGRAREKTMFHFFNNNIGLVLVSQPHASNPLFFDCAFITKYITDTNIFRRGGPKSFPLYLYPETNGQQAIDQSTERTPNLNQEIVTKIAKKLGLKFVPEKFPSRGGNLTQENTFAPIDLLDYIYAVLHSPTYREKYKAFLKIDFPKVPYPKDRDTFWQLVKLGGEIRQIHLLESPAVEKYLTKYPIEGDNTVSKPAYKDGKVYINETQYFDKVPPVAWEFYIGGYQPAQKWLKDRKGRRLSHDDIAHYQKIIAALTETDSLMGEVDRIEME
ncbi:MAG: hypothetical protein OXH57_05975 [Ekhidna sp.]|nr:hypothetical protein [Ekhidna sp.]